MTKQSITHENTSKSSSSCAATSFQVSCPGSLMLFGEHAILHGYDAICCAIDKRMQISLTPREDERMVIQSALGDITTHLGNWQHDLPQAFRYLRGVFNAFGQRFTTGFELVIDSTDIPDNIGFGSSACIVAGGLAVLGLWLNGQPFSSVELHQEALRVVHSVTENKGSGYDLAATIFGGVLKYNAQTQEVSPIVAKLPISLVYCGYKTDTPVVIDKINHNAMQDPERYRALYAKIGQVVTKVQQTMESHDYQALGQLMMTNQKLLHNLGVSDVLSSFIYERLKKAPLVFGAKISGSGLGDCLWALGEVDPTLFADKQQQGVRVIAAAIDQQGLYYE